MECDNLGGNESVEASIALGQMEGKISEQPGRRSRQFARQATTNAPHGCGIAWSRTKTRVQLGDNCRDVGLNKPRGRRCQHRLKLIVGTRRIGNLGEVDHRTNEAERCHQDRT
jgi:hypothetical protein